MNDSLNSSLNRFVDTANHSKHVPFERELNAASSRGRYVNAFSVTGVWSMNENTTVDLTLAGGSLWRKRLRV